MKILAIAVIATLTLLAAATPWVAQLPLIEPGAVAAGAAEAEGATGYDALARCPAERAGTRRLVDDVHGYCVLVPAEYTVERPGAEEIVLVIGSLLNVSDPRLAITTEPAEGLTTEAAVEAALAEWQAALPGIAIARRNVAIGELDAVVLDGLPGQELSRQVLFVRMGVLFRLTFTPADPAAGGYAEMESLYELVVSSFAFLAQ
jgi:hypothetical protein